MPKIAVLVTGGRDFSDRTAVRLKLDEYPEGTLVIHGDAKGADKLAGEEAADLAMGVVKVPYFGHLGRRGGPVRNATMMALLLGLRELGWETHVEAFHDNIAESKGTAGMVRLARKNGYEVEVTGRL